MESSEASEKFRSQSICFRKHIEERKEMTEQNPEIWRLKAHAQYSPSPQDPPEESQK